MDAVSLWAWRRRDATAAGDLLDALRGPAYLALLDASGDAVVGVGEDGLVSFANARTEEMFGGSRAEVLGRPADRFVPHLGDAVQALRRRRAAPEPRPGPGARPARLTALRLDGTRFPASVWLTPVPLRRGLVVAATVRDLSAQYEAEALEQELRAQVREQRDAVDAVLGAVTELVIVLTDADGRITGLNRAAERLLGYRAADLVGESSLRLSDPDEVASAARELRIAPGLDPLLEVTRSGLPNQQDWTYVTSDGERRPVTLRVSAVGDRRNPSGFVCVASERTVSWEPVLTARTGTESLLLDLDDAPTRALRWQVGSGAGRRR